RREEATAGRRGRQRVENRPVRGAGNREDEGLGALHGLGHLPDGSHLARDRDAGEASGMTALGLDGLGDDEVAGPEGDLVAVAGELDREGRAPGARAQDRDLHGFPPSFLSVPAARRLRFSVCFRTTSTATIALARTTARGAWKTRPATGGVTQTETTEPSET